MVDEKSRFVTNSELREELRGIREEMSKLPTVWQMRFMILLAVIATQVLPASDIAHAAVRMIP